MMYCSSPNWSTNQHEADHSLCFAPAAYVWHHGLAGGDVDEPLCENHYYERLNIAGYVPPRAPATQL